jgi:hypothetical protein
MNETYELDSLKALKKVAGRVEKAEARSPMAPAAQKRNPLKSCRRINLILHDL